MLGLTTATAHADAPGVGYSCTLTIPGFPAEQFDTTADFTGTAPTSAQEGDSVTLSQLSVTLHIPTVAALSTLGARGIDGTLSPIEIDAAVGDADGQAGRTGASIVHVDGPVTGAFDLTAAPGEISFDANQPGMMTFGAGMDLDGALQVETLTGGEEDLVLQCSRSGPAATIASTNVTPKPSTPPPSHPSSPSAPPSSSTPPPTHGASAPPSLSNASPSPSSETSSTSAEVGTSNTNRTTAQHPQLANTGFSQAEDLTIGGGLLVLLGGGLMFAARRRSVTDLDT